VNENPNEAYSEYREQILSDKAMMDELRSLNKKDYDLYNRVLEIRAARTR
jgi:hypothetical protein